MYISVIRDWEYKETLKTGGEAAARGGVTTVCAMPNTKPVIDTKEKVEEVHRRAKEESPVHVIQLGAITVERREKSLPILRGWPRQDVLHFLRMASL